MSGGKVDRKALMRSSLTAERKDVRDKFATADQVLADRPGGLAQPALAVATTPVAPPVTRTFSAESYVPGQRRVIRAPISRVHDNPLNARHIYNPETVKSLAASLATHGQKVPANAILHPELPGEFILVDGHYRKRALIAGSMDEIDLLLEENEGDLALYRQSWLLNEERSAQSPLDNAFAWKVLLDKKLVQGETQIADMLGLSGATVNKTLALLNLPAAALDKMRERPEKFGVFAGYELTLAARKLSETELLSLIDRIVTEDLSSRQVAGIRAGLESGSQRKPKENSRQYKIHASGSQIGSLKEWDSGKVQLEVVLADPKDRAALVAELRARFGLQG